MLVSTEKVKELASTYDVLVGNYNNWLTKNQFISLFRSKNRVFLDLFFFKEDFLVNRNEDIIVAGTDTAFRYYREPVYLCYSASVTRTTKSNYIYLKNSKYRYEYFDTQQGRKATLNLYYYKSTWLARVVAAE